MTRLTMHEYAAALRPRYRAAKKGQRGGSWTSSARRSVCTAKPPSGC